MTPSEFIKAAKEAGQDALGIAFDISAENYSREQLVSALEKIAEKYPAVYKHFFFAEVDQEAYHSLFIKSTSLLNEDEDGD